MKIYWKILLIKKEFYIDIKNCKRDVNFRYFIPKGENSMFNKKKASSLLLAGALLVGVPFSASAKTVAKPKPKPLPVVQYVALGDSLAAGQTPTGYIDYGYADYLADNFKKNKFNLADFDNFGVPGYKSQDVKDDVLQSKKIRKEIREATHITIDIGANDLIAVLTDTSKVPATLETVGANLNAALAEIDKLNSKAKVFVMGYYNPYPHKPAAEQQALLPVLEALNGTIEGVARANKDTYVPTATEIGKKPTTYVSNPTDIHLSDAGYKVLTAEFWKAILKRK
jgi:lysophospholipase L1-like esterase